MPVCAASVQRNLLLLCRRRVQLLWSKSFSLVLHPHTACACTLHTYMPQHASLCEAQESSLHVLVLPCRRRTRLHSCHGQGRPSPGRRIRWTAWLAAGSAKAQSGRPQQLWVSVNPVTIHFEHFLCITDIWK